MTTDATCTAWFSATYPPHDQRHGLRPLPDDLTPFLDRSLLQVLLDADDRPVRLQVLRGPYAGMSLAYEHQMTREDVQQWHAIFEWARRELAAGADDVRKDQT